MKTLLRDRAGEQERERGRERKKERKKPILTYPNGKT